MKTKVCSKCKIEKLVNQFNINRKGYASKCKDCQKLYDSNRYMKSSSVYIGCHNGMLKCLDIFLINNQRYVTCECKCGRQMSMLTCYFSKGKSCGNYDCVKNKGRNIKTDNLYERTCKKCNITKPLNKNMFYSNKNSKYGFLSICKDCKKKHLKTRDAKNKRCKYRKTRYNNDKNYRLLDLCRSRMYTALNVSNKVARTVELLGCTPEFLRSHLESLWEPGMSWDNQGNPNGDHSDCWHIDHIIPCSSFDLTDTDEQHKCFHYSNLQPLWATTNTARKYGSKNIGNINKGCR